jgi:hypothetical protein
VEPGFVAALAVEGLGEALAEEELWEALDADALGAGAEAPDPLGVEECPCSSSSHTTASRATAARPIW